VTQGFYLDKPESPHPRDAGCSIPNIVLFGAVVPEMKIVLNISLYIIIYLHLLCIPTM